MKKRRRVPLDLLSEDEEVRVIDNQDDSSDEDVCERCNKVRREHDENTNHKFVE